MGIKCIAIGNRIMGDDSIGIKVLEELDLSLRKENIEVIYAETDGDYALSQIEDEDLLFILDSTYFNRAPGTVTFTSIQDALVQSQNYSQHQLSLINLLKIYKKLINGFIIGIEVNEVNFSLELSECLKVRFLDICKEINDFIYQTIRGEENA